MKFGGTSVAGRPQWEGIARLVRGRRAEGFRVLLVCSAVAGVTNRLEALANDPGDQAALRNLVDLHRRLGQDLGVHESRWLPRAEAQLQECIQRLQRDPGPPAQAGLLALGEWLATELGAGFLQQQGLDVTWVDAREGLEILPEPELSPSRQWLSAACAAGADVDLAARWSELNPTVITQGFVARGAGGRTALLGRGGSDTSAALLAGRLGAHHLEIWTDVPGLFSADPRDVPTARLLAEVDYEEALEMAASGARVVHPRCIRAAAETATPLWIRDLNQPQLEGTRIRGAVTASSGIKTVTCQEGMVVMLLQNLDARRQVGFLAGVFEVFRQHGVSVDLVATSETTTTVAINKKANHLDPSALDCLEDGLAAWCSVTRFDNCVCINFVGRGVRAVLSRMQNVMRYFDDRPLMMLSQSANDLCLSLLAPAGDHRSFLLAAHEALIPDHAEGIFGSSWQEIRSSTSSEQGTSQ